jgi:hypothetical protein
MTYLVPTLRLDRDAMTKYILAIPKTGFKYSPNTGLFWNPVGVVWHNTGVPSTKLWESWSPTTKEAWGDNLDAYYKNQERWHSGPHFVGTPETWSFVLCDLLADGVHDSCRNRNYYGVETVANAEVGGDDPKSGACLAAFQASANIIASLCARFKWNPRTAIDFHRNCKADGHACPGSLVTDDWAIGLVETRLAEINAGAPSP